MSTGPPGKSGASAGVKQQDLLHENQTSIRDSQIIYGILLINLLFLYVLLVFSSLIETWKHRFQQQYQHFYQLGARWKRSHIFFLNQTSWIWCTIKWVGVRGLLVWLPVPTTPCSFVRVCVCFCDLDVSVLIVFYTLISGDLFHCGFKKKEKKGHSHCPL